MKRIICLLLALLLCALAACGGTAATAESDFTWTREGYYSDANDNFLSVTASEDPDYPGWYVSCMLGEDLYGWYIQADGETLHGNVNGGDEDAGPFVVTLTEEGEDGVLLTTEDGERYHFVPQQLEETAISVRVNTDGMGQIAYAAEGETVHFDDEYPFQSAQIGLDGSAAYTLSAKPDEGWRFVKWTRNGEDFAADAEITVELSESAEFVAVFEEAGQ